MVFLKENFEKVDFEKNQQTTKNMQNYPVARQKVQFSISGTKEDSREIRSVYRVLILAQDTEKMNRVTTNIPCSEMLTGK